MRRQPRAPHAVDLASNEGSLHLGGDLAWLQTEAGGILRANSNPDGRDVRLLLNREIDDSCDASHRGFDLTRERPQHCQVIAEDFHGDVGTRAREHVINTMRDRLADRDVHAW
jgi:hypothetical protein